MALMGGAILEWQIGMIGNMVPALDNPTVMLKSEVVVEAMVASQF
jgi:hypothetical protein